MRLNAKMRATLFMKIFFLCSLFSFLLLLYLSVRQFRLTYLENSVMKSAFLEKTQGIVGDGFKETELKYILQWTSPENVPFVYMGKGQKGFIERNCPQTKCFVTADRNYLGDYTKFDVIAFSGPEVVRMSPLSLPSRRSPHQKFVFASIESSDYYPVCSSKLDDFFNWTWTFKLDSDAKWGYMVVRNAMKEIVGPKKEMHWMKIEDMDPVSEELKEQLKSKKKAAAWFVSNCYSRSNREEFVRNLQRELKNYDLTVDVYGRCGTLSCPSDEIKDCDEMLKRDYYFYLSFENSFSEDYVTEKLLHALKNTVIPVVYGGANYTRFMPDGIYLNARELGVQKLAAKMNDLIKNSTEYANYFRWKKYYSYYRRYESLETSDYCRFCSILYEEDLVKNTSIYHNFREWWDPSGRC